MNTPAELATQVSPRTEAGYCSCSYCTAIREGRLKAPENQSIWSRRMGAGR